MKKHPPKKLKKGKKLAGTAKPIYRAWGLATRLEHVKTKEKRK